MGKKSRAKSHHRLYAVLIPDPKGRTYQIGGPDAAVLLDMIACSLEFVSGPALTGFAAYMDQQIADQPCDDGCAGTHTVHVENIGRHTRTAAVKIRQIIAETS